MNKKGFTLIEIIIVIGILLLLVAISIQAATLLQSKTATRNHRIVTQFLMEASQRARAGVHNTDWGVYFTYDAATEKVEHVTIFSGETYATRNTTHDIVIPANQSTTFTFALSDVAPYTGSGFEVVFEQASGDPHQTGTITLTADGDANTITITPTGFAVYDR